MAKDEALPYYKWLVRDYRSNRKVQRMSWQAKGLYRELLDEFWIDGPLPNDMEALREICGCSKKEFEKFWPEIEPSFSQDEQGRWISPKMNAQRTDKDMERVVKKAAGRLGGLTKIKNSLESADDLARVAHPLADAKQVLADAKQVLADAKQVPYSRAEQSRGEESKSKVSEAKASSPRDPSGDSGTRPQEFANSWNLLRGHLSRVMDFTESRKRKVIARQRQGISLEEFEKAVAKCASIPFLSGDNKQGWKANFDWLVDNDKNLLKVLEGKYDVPTVANTQARPQLRSVTLEEAMQR